MTDSLLELPTEFAIKAMGLNDGRFFHHVIALILAHAPDLDHSRVTQRPSRNGRYLAVTVMVNASDQAQLDAIYQDLSASSQVVMAL